MERRDFNDPRYKAWRKRVYVRDKFKCQFPGCASQGGYLEAHHIERWADAPMLRFATSNGITLCKACHDRIKDREHDFAATFKSIVAGKSGGSAAMDILFLKYGKKNDSEAEA